MSILSTVPKGAAVEGINPNLLRNWYFVGGGTGRGVFPVNSRGQTSYAISSTGASCIDGWNYQNKNNSLDLTQNGLVWQSSTASGAIWLLQSLNYSSSLFLGKYITCSILLSSGALSQVTIGPIVMDQNNDAYISLVGSQDFFIRFYFNSTTLASSFTLRRDRAVFNMTIQAIKVELGTEQTLAHQENGAWVLNEIPDYEEEYYRCITNDADSTDTYANQKVSNITVQCNSVGSSSLRYYNNLIQSTHKVLDSTFSNPAAQTSDITVTTYDGYLDFSNGFASGATTNITLVLGTSGPVLSTSTTAPS